LTDSSAGQQVAKLTRQEIMDRAREGDRSILPQLRKILDAAPDITRQLGDLEDTAREAMLKRTAGKHLARREAQSRFLKELKAQVAGPSPTILEDLLASQIVLCWQHLRYAETIFAQARDYTLTQEDAYQKQIDRAQRRYLEAIKALAHVRKLCLSPVQVNIAAEGGRQVNVTQASERFIQ